MAMPTFEKTADGFETQFQTNHLGHFVLAELLTPTLAATARAAGSKGRVVVLSSAAQYMAPVSQGLPFDSFTSPAGYNAWITYGRTKLCVEGAMQVPFCYDAKRLQQAVLSQRKRPVKPVFLCK